MAEHQCTSFRFSPLFVTPFLLLFWVGKVSGMSPDVSPILGFWQISQMKLALRMHRFSQCVRHVIVQQHTLQTTTVWFEFLSATLLFVFLQHNCVLAWVDQLEEVWKNSEEKFTWYCDSDYNCPYWHVYIHINIRVYMRTHVPWLVRLNVFIVTRTWLLTVKCVSEWQWCATEWWYSYMVAIVRVWVMFRWLSHGGINRFRVIGFMQK